eukprot:Opistho-2@80252
MVAACLGGCSEFAADASSAPRAEEWGELSSFRRSNTDSPARHLGTSGSNARRLQSRSTIQRSFSMRFKSLALGAALASAALLSACGGGGSDDSKANIRLLNATRSYSSLDLSVDDSSVNSNVTYASVGSYGSVDTHVLCVD